MGLRFEVSLTTYVPFGTVQMLPLPCWRWGIGAKGPSSATARYMQALDAGNQKHTHVDASATHYAKVALRMRDHTEHVKARFLNRIKL